MNPPIITTQEARGPIKAPRTLSGEDAQAWLRDAASTPGGHCAKAVLPKCEGELAWLLKNSSDALLTIGAQSSLTGGATPFGEVIVCTAELSEWRMCGEREVEVQSGLALFQIQQELKKRGLFFPPVPTYDGAFIGGAIATNAAGAQTFKYGATRPWVKQLRVMLANGDVLDLARGQHRAVAGQFHLQTSTGLVTIPVPSYKVPDVPKVSAGYFCSPDLDLIDLFIGSEGTLGLILSAQLRCAPLDFERLRIWLTFPSEEAGLRFSAELRDAARSPSNPIDIASIESVDARCLELLRQDGADRREGVTLTADRKFAILFDLELRGDDIASVTDALEATLDGRESSHPVAALARLLVREDLLDHLEMALPGDERRSEQFFRLRDRVPTCVNHLVADAQRDIDSRITKTAADMIAPWSRFAESLAIYHKELGSRGLDYAIWGHISDGNLHPNVIPRSYDDVVKGREAILAMGDAIIAMGGSPLAEHGVGRSPMKQGLLKKLYGSSGIDQMRAVKAALDPTGRLAPGVLFGAKV